MMEDPSVCRIHPSSLSFISSLFSIIYFSIIDTSRLLLTSVMKPARSRALILVRGLKLISCSPRSMTHLGSHPNFLGFSSTFHIGVLANTFNVCAKKYLLNRLAAFTSANASFSMSGYPISTPYNTRLTKYIGSFLSRLLATNTTFATSFNID